MSDNVAAHAITDVGCSVAPQEDGWTTGVVKASTSGLLAILVLALLTTWPMRPAGAETAAELIEQARQYDATRTVGPEVNRTKALEVYGKALAAQPDQQQRLDVLFRMAQLHGCVFNRKKGEQPDYRKAISLYQQIVESYPPEEPMVITAIGLISDHYTSLREFDAALTWARRAVEYDTTKVEEQINDSRRKEDSLAHIRYTPDERQAIIDQVGRRASLEENLQRMKTGRVVAVERLARAAQSVDPLRAHGELRAIADRYAGTPVGDRATEKLQEAMDRHSDLWTPGLRPPQGPATTWHPAPGATEALTNQKTLAQLMKPGAEITAEAKASDPNAAEEPRAVIPLTECPRGPPSLLLSACLVVAAGFAIFSLAVPRTRRETLSRNRKYET